MMRSPDRRIRSPTVWGERDVVNPLEWDLLAAPGNQSFPDDEPLVGDDVFGEQPIEPGFEPGKESEHDRHYWTYQLQGPIELGSEDDGNGDRQYQ